MIIKIILALLTLLSIFAFGVNITNNIIPKAKWIWLALAASFGAGLLYFL